jgi:DNA polymerase-4
MEPAATILHADLDAFYASVEQLLNPELRGKPIAVGGGVVLAASYEAKAFGVHGGMSGWAAKELCPELIFTGGHFEEYQRLGDAAIGILDDYTPLVERISIDEAFADVAGCEHLFGSPETIARTVRARVRAELGLPISVGVARTKHLAKIASQVAKPDGLVVVDPVRELEFLHPLPVSLMWGVGPVTEGKLEDEGILTIGQLAEQRTEWVQRILGHAAGEKLSALAWNRDPRGIVTNQRARSAGAQSALGKKPFIERIYRPTLHHLADRIASRLRVKSWHGHTITARVRFRDLRAVTRSITIDQPISATVSLAEIAEDLVRVVQADHPDERTITLLAISVAQLERDPLVQLELPLDLADDARRPGTRRGASRLSADRAMDAVRIRFGREAIGYASATLELDRSVPDAFRGLAEKPL